MMGISSGTSLRNGQPMRLFAAPLAMNLGRPNPLEGVDFFVTEGELLLKR
jgi:hypothetical protein